MRLTDLIPFYHHHDQLPEESVGYANPFHDMDRAMEDLFPNLSLDPSVSASLANLTEWVPKPQIDVEDTGQDIVVTAEIPGLDGQDLDIRLVDGGLQIRGEKHRETSEDESATRSRERWFGHFERWVALPAAVDGSKAEASAHNGVVTIRLPRANEVSAIRIPVKAA